MVSLATSSFRTELLRSHDLEILRCTNTKYLDYKSHISALPPPQHETQHLKIAMMGFSVINMRFLRTQPLQGYVWSDHWWIVLPSNELELQHNDIKARLTEILHCLGTSAASTCRTVSHNRCSLHSEPKVDFLACCMSGHAQPYLVAQQLGYQANVMKSSAFLVLTDSEPCPCSPDPRNKLGMLLDQLHERHTRKYINISLLRWIILLSSTRTSTSSHNFK